MRWGASKSETIGGEKRRTENEAAHGGAKGSHRVAERGRAVKKNNDKIDGLKYINARKKAGQMKISG